MGTPATAKRLQQGCRLSLPHNPLAEGRGHEEETGVGASKMLARGGAHAKGVQRGTAHWAAGLLLFFRGYLYVGIMLRVHDAQAVGQASLKV